MFAPVMLENSVSSPLIVFSSDATGILERPTWPCESSVEDISSPYHSRRNHNIRGQGIRLESHSGIELARVEKILSTNPDIAGTLVIGS